MGSNEDCLITLTITVTPGQCELAADVLTEELNRLYLESDTSPALLKDLARLAAVFEVLAERATVEAEKARRITD
jgi:hypothetical protein